MRDIMDADPVTVAPGASVEEVVKALRTNELTGIPVVNDGGRCVGIITENDLVMAGDEGDLGRELEAPLPFQHAEHGDGMGHQRGLGIGGEG